MWQDDLTATFNDGTAGGSSYLDEYSSGKSFRPTTLIAGGHKLDQLLVEPFQAFHASLLRHVHEADAIVVGGYGLGDEHVNRALRSRLASGAPRPRLMILDFTHDDIRPLQGRNDSWSWKLLKPYCVQRGQFLPNAGGVSSVRRLKVARGFEIAEGHTAVWHNGFVEAHERIDSIADWLDGADAAVLRP
jgi:hypothetical protein